MIQDIAPHKFHNEYRPGKTPSPESPVICFDGRKILLNEETSELPRSEMLDITEQLYYAFSVDDTEYFLYTGDRIFESEGFGYSDIRRLRSHRGNVFGMIMFTGFHLCEWYKDNIFCGRCGSPTIHSETERAMHCPSCGRTIYPRIMPAVIVAVTDNDKLLVTKYREGYNHYALVAGFAEIGETLEETVAREVMEETGLRVRNIKYYKSQPWGIANDILMGYYCDVDGSNEIHIDDNELKLAEWKKPEEIELQPDTYSLTNEMMTVFRNKGSRPD